MATAGAAGVGWEIAPSLMNVITVRTTRISAAPSGPPDLEPRVAADLCSHAAPSGSVADERVHEHPLDRNEDGESHVEHELVEGVDLVGVGRTSGLGR